MVCLITVGEYIYLYIFGGYIYYFVWEEVGVIQFVSGGGGLEQPFLFKGYLL